MSEGELSGYTLGKVLGQGTYGVVRLATHNATGEIVAIKHCDISHATKKTRDSLTREVEVMRVLDHPNILKLKDVILLPTKLCLVVEYVDHGELFDYIVKNTRIEPTTARKMFLQICKGVQYCHSHAVVHRDLKCENVLLDHEYNVKIIDFGFAKAFEAHSSLQTQCGSPHYTAPEVHSSQPYGPECDIWSMGCILFAMLAGYLPFDGSEEEIQALAAAMEYTIPDEVQGQARDLITRMLIADPKARISLTDVMAHAYFTEK
jgi:serine/threonine protein kinase